MDTIKALIKRMTTGRNAPEATAPDQPARNYTQERETTRTGGLSADYQAWETDRLRREQAAREEPRPPEHS